jgi:prepilin signal peptidase PulO-like enzyme (type II secretory pathway)
MSLASVITFAIFSLWLSISDIKTRSASVIPLFLFILSGLFFSWHSGHISSGLYGSLSGFLIFFIVRAIYPSGFGLGDCTLAAGLGAFLGSEKLSWCILTACLFLIIFVSLDAFLKGLFLKREKRIPFVPFLCLSGFLFFVY